MRKLLGLLLLLLTACGSPTATATPLTKDRTFDAGDTARVPAAAEKPALSAKQALAACRKEGPCDRSRPTIELADVTTNNGSLRNELTYVMTWHHLRCSSAGPSSVTTTCTAVTLVNATTGHVAYALDYSQR